MLADMGKHASPPKLTATPSPPSMNGIEVKALEARIKELEQLLRLHESRGMEQQNLQNTSRVSRLSPDAAGEEDEEDTDREAEKVTFKHQRQFSARERLLRESAEEAEAAAEAAACPLPAHALKTSQMRPLWCLSFLRSVGSLTTG